jgi:hypothetical protein
VEWLVTPAVMAEYIAVIQRPRFALPTTTVTWWLELLASDTRVIQPRALKVTNNSHIFQ